MTVNERIYDIAVRHAINLLRQREGLVDTVEESVRVADRAFVKKIRIALSRLSKADLDRIATTGAYTTKAAKALEKLIREHGRNSLEAAEAALNPEVRDLMEMETGFWQQRINGVLPAALALGIAVPATSKLFKEYRQRLVGDLGGNPRSRLAGWASRRVDAITRTLRNAAPSGNPATILARIGGRSGILGLGYKGLGGEVRSIHNHATEVSKQVLADENDLIQDLVWVSVLDSRTSDICFSRNGMLINKELNGQVPPAHINCRSTTILGVKSWRQLQEKGLSNSARNALDGRLVGADSESSTTWFARQSKATQREILGPTRYKLYKEGGLKFPNDFINRKEDRINLDELRRREADAFDKADIE